MKPMSQQDMEKVMEGFWILFNWLKGSEEVKIVPPTEENKWSHVPEVLSVKEMAELMNISQWMAYELCRTPDFPAVRIGRRVLVRRDQLMTWLDREAGLGS